MPESLVLLHGFASTRRLWDAVIARLPPERYTALALDLPGHGEQGLESHGGLDLRGHGEQGSGGGAVTFDGCVTSVLARSPERFVLAGYSMGGRVALHVALAAPERVARLVLIAATPGIEDERERASRSARDRELASRIEREPLPSFIDRWRAQEMFARDPPQVDALAREAMASNPPEGVAAALRGIGTGEMAPLWDRLSELEMPVTVVAGERDTKFRAIGERMARALPDGRFLLLPGGHVLPLESPQAVADAVGA